MNRTRHSILTLAVFVTGALASAIAIGADVNVRLTGANEVPPVQTSASGQGKFTVADDGALSGRISTTGVAATVAHIHTGAAGMKGPPIVPLTKQGDTFEVPAGAKLNAEQMKAFKAGELYVNVHSAANPGGEIRAQLK
ncbi:MAG TPA: CHRD domain-containing protein [Burkholderiaceae bacterium]|nr:CHRD domain-containing protein [Burkholderiaceae bacterium]